MTPHKRFVEAMRGLMGGFHAYNRRHVEDAIDAFADAECGGGGMDCSGPDSKFAATEHAACRASLRKECGM